MIKVKLTTSSPSWPLLRQTPSSSGEWGGVKFYVNDESVTECDYWVVYDGLPNREAAVCPQGNIIFIASEPPEVKRYSSRFLGQFSTVVSCDRSIQHPDVRFVQQSLPWMVGVRQTAKGASCVMDYDRLASDSPPRKIKLLSVVTTKKTMTAGHKSRLAFVEKLMRRYGPEIDVFGRGFSAIEDKWDAIAPYKYHLVLENSCLEDYFTEKITDAFLGLAYPIYWGCPNLSDYFPEKSFSRIHLDDVEAIGRIIDDSSYEKSQAHLAESKRLVLDKHNLFAFLSGLITSLSDRNVKLSSFSSKAVTLFPENYSGGRLAMLFDKLKFTKRCG